MNKQTNKNLHNPKQIFMTLVRHKYDTLGYSVVLLTLPTA